jgi:hypothetical protein
MSQLIPPYPLILDRLNSGRVIPFLGSGASLGGRQPGATLAKGFLPTASELAGHLADRTEFPADESRDLTKVAQYYGVVGGRSALNEELHSIFNCDYQLTSLHSFLASVTAPLLIVTTNYDDLIERALDERNVQLGENARPYEVVIHNAEITKKGGHLWWWPYGESAPREVRSNKLLLDIEKRTIVYKMHGAVDRKESSRDSYVISEDDYIEFLARMTKSKAIPAIFADPFQTRHFLFLGYGLNDWNLRVVLNRVGKDLRRPKGITSWAIQHQTKPLERRFWQERGVEVYDQKLDDFVQQLTSNHS